MSVLKFKNSQTGVWEEIETIIGPPGPAGEDGYTPIKGIDYFDGTTGPAGEDGHTPVKGVDYFTEADKEELTNSLIVRLDNEIVPTDEQWEVIKSILATGMIPCPIYMNNLPVIGAAIDGSISTGGSVYLYTGQHLEQQNISDEVMGLQYFRYYKVYDTAEPSAVKYRGTVYLSSDYISLKSSNTPGGKTRLKDALNYLDTNKIERDDVEIILSEKSYQTEEQVNALITTALGNIGVAEEGSY